MKSILELLECALNSSEEDEVLHQNLKKLLKQSNMSVICMNSLCGFQFAFSSFSVCSISLLLRCFVFNFYFFTFYLFIFFKFPFTFALVGHCGLERGSRFCACQRVGL